MPSRLAPGIHGDYRVPGRYREKDIAFSQKISLISFIISILINLILLSLYIIKYLILLKSIEYIEFLIFL